MEKETSAVKSFLGELEETKNPFEEAPENPFEETEVVAPKEEVVEEEKPLPFNKDPKIQKFIEKEISKRLENFKTEAPREVQTEEDSFKDVIESFTTVIGNDTPEKVNALNALKKSLSSLDQRASQKAIEQLESIKADEVRADQEAEQELQDAFENIEESFDVDITSNNPLAKKTRQEFVGFIEKIAPKDRNGDIVDYPDMNSAWETFSEMKKATATPNRAKELASRGMSRSAETTTVPTRKPTWDAADDYIASLK